jgi:hypothetical protein
MKSFVGGYFNRADGLRLVVAMPTGVPSFKTGMVGETPRLYSLALFSGPMLGGACRVRTAATA